MLPFIPTSCCKKNVNDVSGESGSINTLSGVIMRVDMLSLMTGAVCSLPLTAASTAVGQVW